MQLHIRKTLPSIQFSQNLIAGVGVTDRVIDGLLYLTGTLIVGKSASKLSRICNIIAKFSDAGWHIEILESGEPNFSTLEEIARRIPKDNRFNLVAIGGGSVIDCAKALKVFMHSPEILSRNFDSRRIKAPNSLTGIGLAAFPTTLGSGSESSSAALIYNRFNMKTALAGKSLIPDVAVLDPDLIVRDPRITSRSLMDALCHSFEAYVSKIYNPYAQLLSVNSAKCIISNLEGSIRENAVPSLDIQIACNHAGIAQEYKLTGVAHAIGHSFTNFSHGLAIAHTFPSVFDYYMEHSELLANLTNEYLVKVGVSQDRYRLLLHDLYLESGGLETFNQIPKLTDSLLLMIEEDPSVIASPIPISRELVEAVFWKIGAYS